MNFMKARTAILLPILFAVSSTALADANTVCKDILSALSPENGPSKVSTDCTPILGTCTQYYKIKPAINVGTAEVNFRKDVFFVADGLGSQVGLGKSVGFEIPNATEDAAIQVINALADIHGMKTSSNSSFSAEPSPGVFAVISLSRRKTKLKFACTIATSSMPAVRLPQ